MQRFIGTKVVLAQPMSRQQYLDYRGWVLPEGEDPKDRGYLVEDTDGGKPNDSRHEGYITWSPKEQFDKAYAARPAVEGLAPHQQRVVDEKVELDEKMSKLETFVHGSYIFDTLDRAEQERLCRQLEAMGTYSDALAERIAAF